MRKTNLSALLTSANLKRVLHTSDMFLKQNTLRGKVEKFPVANGSAPHLSDKGVYCLTNGVHFIQDGLFFIGFFADPCITVSLKWFFDGW